MTVNHKLHFLATIDYSDYPEFAERAHVLVNGDDSILGQLRFAVKVFKASKNESALLLDSASGSIHPDLLAAVLIGFWRRTAKPVIVMMGDMWHNDKGLRGFLQKVALRLADGAIVRYAPLSSDEFPIFEKTWGISRLKLRFLPYFYTFTKADLNSPSPPQEDFIFSGGNAHRDYETLLQAAEALPAHKFVIGSHLLDGRKLPSNVTAGQVPRTEFIRLMRASRMVIVPILPNLTRSTGHQTYLNAMLLGKPTIVNDTLGVREHVRHGETAIVVDGSPEGYVEAVRRVIDPANQAEMQRICNAAQEDVLTNFSFEKHCERLFDILDEAIEEYSRSRL